MLDAISQQTKIRFWVNITEGGASVALLRNAPLVVKSENTVSNIGMTGTGYQQLHVNRYITIYRYIDPALDLGLKVY